MGMGEKQIIENFWRNIPPEYRSDILKLREGVIVQFPFMKNWYEVNTFCDIKDTDEFVVEEFESILEKRAVEAVQKKHYAQPRKIDMKNEEEQGQVVYNNPDKVWCTVERTVNLGNYENVKIQLGEAKTIGPGDKPEKLRDKLTSRLLDELDDYAKEYK